MRNKSFSWHPKAASSLVSHFQKNCVLIQMKQICLQTVVLAEMTSCASLDTAVRSMEGAHRTQC